MGYREETEALRQRAEALERELAAHRKALAVREAQELAAGPARGRLRAGGALVASGVLLFLTAFVVGLLAHLLPPYDALLPLTAVCALVLFTLGLLLCSLSLLRAPPPGYAFVSRRGSGWRVARAGELSFLVPFALPSVVQTEPLVLRLELELRLADGATRSLELTARVGPEDTVEGLGAFTARWKGGRSEDLEPFLRERLEAAARAVFARMHERDLDSHHEELEEQLLETLHGALEGHSLRCASVGFRQR